MPRTRRLSPEQRSHDNVIARGCHSVLAGLLGRYPGNGELRMAMRCIDEFQVGINTAPSTPDSRQPRARKPKPLPDPQPALAEV